MREVFWASLKKELREALRDKRALFLTILMPLVFYPAMVGVNVWMQHSHQQKEADKVLRVGVMGDLEWELLPSDQIGWSQVESSGVEVLLGERQYDVLVETESDGTLRLHYHSGHGGKGALLRVEEALSQYRQLLVAGKLHEQGVDPAILHPFAMKTEDHASVRQRQSGEIGGVGAYFLVFLAMTGCMAVAVDTAAGEKERGTLEAMLATPASFTALAAGKLIYVVLMGCLSVLSTFLGIFALAYVWGMSGAVSQVSHQGGAGLWAGLSIAMLVGALGLLLVMVFLFATLLFGVSIMARSTKEAHMRSVLLMLLVAMSLVYSTLPGIAISGAVMWVPVLNIALALRGLWEGSLSAGSYWGVLGMTLGLALLVLGWFSSVVRRNPEKTLLKQ